MKENGVRFEFSVAGTPQQNGLAEVSNRIVLEGSRSLIHAAHLPTKFWNYAVKTKVFQLNRTGTTIRGMFTTPYEQMWNKKPNLQHMRIFGANGFGQRLLNRKKLDERSEACVFLGYSEVSQSYIVNWLRDGAIGHTRTLLLDEDTFLKEVEAERRAHLRCSLRRRDLIENLEHDYNESNNQQSNSMTHQQRANPIQFLDDSDISEDEDAQALTTASVDPGRAPRHYYEALTFDDYKSWVQAYQSEIDSLESVGQLQVVPRPQNKEVLPILELFTYKYDGITQRIKHKVRIVVRGDVEKQPPEKKELYSPVAHSDSIKTILALTGAKNMKIKQCDIKTAYLYGRRTEEIFVELPIGHKDRQKKKNVWVTKASVYGLRDAPRLWNEHLNKTLLMFGLKRSVLEPCLYKLEEELFYVLIYVDDIIYAGISTKIFERFEKHLEKSFNIKIAGEINQYVGFQINQSNQGLTITCSKYIENITNRYRVADARAMMTPAPQGIVLFDESHQPLRDRTKYQSIIGALMYATTLCRSDVSYIVNYLARFNQKPTKELFRIAKRVLIYLSTTKDLGVTHKPSKKMVLTGFVDSDWAGERHDRKSVSGYIIYFNDSPLVYRTKKQTVVALSSMEAEYMALSQCIQHALYIKRLLRFLDTRLDEPLTVFCDNQAAISAMRSAEVTKKSKHIHPRYHETKKTIAEELEKHETRKMSKHVHLREKYLQDLVMKDKVLLRYVPSESNPADLLTKVVATKIFERLRKRLVN